MKFVKVDDSVGKLEKYISSLTTADLPSDYNDWNPNLDFISSTITKIIPINEQIIIFDKLTIDGQVTIDGQLILIEYIKPDYKRQWVIPIIPMVPNTWTYQIPRQSQRLKYKGYYWVNVNVNFKEQSNNMIVETRQQHVLSVANSLLTDGRTLAVSDTHSHAVTPSNFNNTNLHGNNYLYVDGDNLNQRYFNITLSLPSGDNMTNMIDSGFVEVNYLGISLDTD